VEHGHCFSSAFHPIVGQFGLEKMLFALSVGQNFKKNEFANSIKGCYGFVCERRMPPAHKPIFLIAEDPL
jgi:hypothetical protein